jgi:hypothetical protein
MLCIGFRIEEPQSCFRHIFTRISYLVYFNTDRSFYQLSLDHINNYVFKGKPDAEASGTPSFTPLRNSVLRIRMIGSVGGLSLP